MLKKGNNRRIYKLDPKKTVHKLIILNEVVHFHFSAHLNIQ